MFNLLIFLIINLLLYVLAYCKQNQRKEKQKKTTPAKSVSIVTKLSNNSAYINGKFQGGIFNLDLMFCNFYVFSSTLRRLKPVWATQLY